MKTTTWQRFRESFVYGYHARRTEKPDIAIRFEAGLHRIWSSNLSGSSIRVVDPLTVQGVKSGELRDRSGAAGKANYRYDRGRPY